MAKRTATSPIEKKGRNILLEMALIIALSLLFYLSIPIKSYAIVYIPKGALKTALSHLHALESPTPPINTLDLWILRLMSALHLWHTPERGYVAIPISPNNTTTKGDFLHALSLSKVVYKDITLIPGETLYFFLRHLAKVFHLKVEDLEQVYNAKALWADGAIVPDTYRFTLGISTQNLMGYLLKHSQEHYQKLSEQLLGNYDPKKWQQTLIIASIIQKEAANAAEMPLIAGVIYNRLKRHMPLQMDGALNYGAYAHSKVTHERIATDNSPYNTYKHKGLPKEPVGSVGLDAIKAALFPAKTPFLYFVKTKGGTHKFSVNYKEHVRAIPKF
ncbi:endolytic transglycosylase MltG [Helicobacter sp. NHP22-001]|uniref:endolytic transglycosylase MltG n=1 Tax=Helicobacter sp. NHP22-001 TaxID=3040202 RepID=UPI00255287B5|nr:endolytic transglycosylase MltG [Helicobacter sp. NHP22-001]